MNNNSDNLPPVSEGSVAVTQTLLKTGMMLAPEKPGTVGSLDNYEILNVVGVGGMGQVLRAREKVTGREVAIKMIKPEFLEIPEIRERFVNEARHMHKMNHKNILKVIELSDRKEGPFYVMPYIEHGNLAQKMEENKKLDEEQIVDICIQLAEAIKYAHNRGIIHRDLKPENILIDADGNVYLTDFGLLRTVFNDSILDVEKSHVEGTAPYMSPGVAEGKAEDTRCDIYAFGAIMYEMLTGRKPFTAANSYLTIKEILKGPPPPIREIAPNVSEKLEIITERAMARELRDRYAEMNNIIDDLNKVVKGENIVPAKKKSGPNRILIFTLLGIIILVGALIVNEQVLPSLSSGSIRLGFLPILIVLIIPVFLFYMFLRFLLSPEVSPIKKIVTTGLIGLLLFVITALSVVIFTFEHPQSKQKESNAQRYRFQGWQSFNKLKFIDAEKYFRKAASLDPKNADAWNGLGWSQFNMGMDKEAKKAFEKSLALNPKITGALNGMGCLARKEGKMADAKKYWIKSIEAAPNLATAAMASLAHAYMAEGNYTEAVKYYKMTLSKLPGGNKIIETKLKEAEEKLLLKQKQLQKKLPKQ